MEFLTTNPSQAASGTDPHQALRLSLTVKELDVEVCHYLKARRESGAVGKDDDPVAHQEMIGQIILAQPGSLLAKEVRLSFAGLSLANFVIEGYNDAQVARDSDGHQP